MKYPRSWRNVNERKRSEDEIVVETGNYLDLGSIKSKTKLTGNITIIFFFLFFLSRKRSRSRDRRDKDRDRDRDRRDREKERSKSKRSSTRSPSR